MVYNRINKIHLENMLNLHSNADFQITLTELHVMKKLLVLIKNKKKDQIWHFGILTEKMEF